ncbi:MFS transporter [Verrucomicrobium spinosum]|uniref:MFS transporter n=1 Tax=Verrucomicrobium spinosum TaxID=2736 RepID=UPI0001746844|nr:MFS transporter [Verrucomicrobium spinosum]
MSDSPSPRPSWFPIYLLSAAGFTILTTEFVIVGLLPPMARDLKVTVSQAGLLVTLFAFTVAIVGPPLTAWVSRFDRKRLFVATLLLFAVSNLIAALAPNIGIMAFARFIPAVMLPVFWSLASETAVNITGPAKSGKAIFMVSFGIVVATIFGIPIGTLISDAFGWRLAFGALAGLALLKAVLLQIFMPAVRPHEEPVSVNRQLAVLKDPLIVGHVVLSMLVFAGMFTAYTYLADILEKLARFDGSTVGWCLMGFGAVGLLGNWLSSRIVDKRPLGVTLLFGSPMVVAMAVLVPVIHQHVLLGIVLVVWGICQAALFTGSHVRVMKAVTQAPALGASLNISGANIGIGLGAIVGGRVLDSFGLANVGLAAAIVVVLALTTTLVLINVTRSKAKASAATVPGGCVDCS